MARRGAAETLSNDVRGRLRADILTGKWIPGQKLQLVALSKHYGTSSTVVREALTRLAGERLVSLRPNRGFIVPELSLGELRDFNELRCITEEFAITLAIERGDLEWESEVFAAHHRLEHTPRYVEGSQHDLNFDWQEKHAAFHQQLIAACNLPVLIDFTQHVSDENSLYRRWAAPNPRAKKRDLDQEHRDILAAVLDRDAARAASLLRHHYTTTMELILEGGLIPEATHDEA